MLCKIKITPVPDGCEGYAYDIVSLGLCLSVNCIDYCGGQCDRCETKTIAHRI